MFTRHPTSGTMILHRAWPGLNRQSLGGFASRLLAGSFLGAKALRLMLLTTLWVLPALTVQADKHNPMLFDVAPKPVTAHPFEGENLAGDLIRLGDLKGKLVFVNFWATWCTPCVLEMPAMERLNRKMAGKPFVMLAVNQAESQERIEGFLKQRKFKFSYELVLDQLGEIGAYYAVDRLPMTYLIDPEGRVTHRAIGPREWDSAESVAYLEGLLKGARPASAAQVQPSPVSLASASPLPGSGVLGPSAR